MSAHALLWLVAQRVGRMFVRRDGSRPLHLRNAFVLVIAVVVVCLAPAGAQGVAGGDQPCPAEPARFNPCALLKARTFMPPRTVDGHPDLQGFWRGQPAATENVEEHPK